LNNISMEYYTKSVFLRNIGPGTITVSNAYLTGGDTSCFQIVDTNSFPAGVSWPDTLISQILFDPVSIGEKSTTLRLVTSTDGNLDIELKGEAYVAPAQDLAATSNDDFGIDLDWDPPLPENELRYDNGNITNWYWVGDPTSDQHYFYTRLTSPVTGTLDYVAVFTRNNVIGTDWKEILVCPDNGSGQPDLSIPIESYSDVVVNSTTGEWILLPLTIPESMIAGTDFYIVTRWPAGSSEGPFVGTDATSNFNRCAWTDNGGTTWNDFSVSWIMRAYISSAADGILILNAGDPDVRVGDLEVLSPVVSEGISRARMNSSYPLPGIWEDHSNRELLEYRVHRGTSSGSYDTHYMGITATGFEDNSGLIPGQGYFYAVTAHYSDGQVSDSSNESYTTVRLPIDGALTIGPGGDYPTLTGNGGLFEAVNSSILTGNLEVTILEDITEPGIHPLNEVFRSGGNHTFEIQPTSSSRSPVVLSGNVSGGLIRFNGADHVTINGSGNQLTIINNGTSDARVIDLYSGSAHNTIRECNLATGDNSTYSNFCIYASGVGIDSNAFTDNHLVKSYEGIYLYGDPSSYNF
jgi:hypothetical protein